MLINTSLSPETAARDLRNSRAADASPAPGRRRPPAIRPRFRTWGGCADWPRWMRREFQQSPIAAGADQAAGFIRANLSSQHGLALAAQANLDPESAYNLLK